MRVALPSPRGAIGTSSVPLPRSIGLVRRPSTAQERSSLALRHCTVQTSAARVRTSYVSSLISEPSLTMRVLKEACSTTAGATSTIGRTLAELVSLRVTSTFGTPEIFSDNQRGGRGLDSDSLGALSPKAASAATAKTGGIVLP